MSNEALLSHSRDLQNPGAEDALVGQIVYCVDGGRVREEGIVAVHGAHPVGDHGGVPIVAMQDIGLPHDLLAQLQPSAAEEEESLRVVGLHVDAIAVVETRVLHKVHGHALPEGAFQDGGRLVAIVPGHGETLGPECQAELVREDHTVAGHH